MLKQKKSLKLGILAALMIFLVGCGTSKLVMFPITDKDIYFKDNGDICMSEFYFNTVLQAKIEKVKK